MHSSLIVLPFDHRGSFMKKMFGIEGREPSAEETALICLYKNIIYQGFLKGVEIGNIPHEAAAILVDEQFGDAILKDAKVRGYITCIPVEKSGQDEFDFEYGDEFAAHIEKYKPSVVKALVRYNPQGDVELNTRQLARLNKLSTYCHNNGYRLMVEPLIPATAGQLAQTNGDEHLYDTTVRPQLMVELIAQFQTGGVEPDIWKIEGFESAQQYSDAVSQARCDGRDHVIAIVLGRAAADEQVNAWLVAGSGVAGVEGFAIGRTIFWDALLEYKNGTLDEAAAAQKIGERFVNFYRVFTQNA